MNLVSIALRVEDLCKEVGAYIKEQAKQFTSSSIEYKGKNDLVSYVDKTAEQKLIDGLKLLLPESGFLTEEQTVQNDNKSYTWIIDPLDGTTNFIHSLPIYAISVALEINREIVLGVVYEINKEEMFRATKGDGAFLNSVQISCTKTEKLSETLLATGFPYYNFEQMSEYLRMFSTLMKETHGLRRLGSAAVDLAYVACGRFDGFYEYNLNPWDVAGGALIVKEAGGVCVDFQGGDDYVYGRSIIAGNSIISKAIQEVAKKSGF